MKNSTDKQSSDSQTIAMLVFTVGKQDYGLPVTQVVRIIEMVTIVEIHGVSEVIQGVINLQGQAVPVMDMRRRLGFASQSPGLHTPIILVDVPQKDAAGLPIEGTHLLGLIVDEVSQVIDILSENIKQTTAQLPGELSQLMNRNAAYLDGIINVNRKMVIVLNLAALLSSADYMAVVGSSR